MHEAQDFLSLSVVPSTAGVVKKNSASDKSSRRADGRRQSRDAALWLFSSEALQDAAEKNSLSPADMDCLLPIVMT
ncbi:hypothetical protein CQW49_18230 [Methylosinus trichosporium OB3b]|uniref:Uncharacterized protein n=1 Tax=Methylosinus trichosporium (strain ATCC 35070 / NCIMB 11131 / UNIQEM 75 / OB3b) TaxID=595536 RepID=A0A2D2D3Q1_METT3|nr:hypothetical protein CQW49_18230 [Methylosinus trichosporium OB3b]OBS52026.1 hypothetical protein A8B73_13315 [Methylosinus sp. 3S-1]